MKHKLEFIKISDQHEFAGVGFAGNIFIVLNALTHISNEDELYVDMETNPCCCTDHSQTIFETKNCWEYYFDQTTKENINNVFNSLLGANIHYNDKDFFMNPENFIDLKNKFNKNFKLKQNITEEIQSFYDKKIKNKITLGVQVRLTDMRHYHGVSPVDEYIKKIKEILSEKPEIEQIFLSTDDSEIIDVLKNNIDKPIVYYEEMFRANKNDPHLHPYDRFYNSRPMHRYLIGVECCQEIFTLSKCDYMLKADVSSISIIASILSENIKKVYKL